MAQQYLDPVALQRRYYRETAADYDSLHISEAGEHEFALTFMIAMIDYLNIASVLDIGSGTGRAIMQVKSKAKDLRVCGIEPSTELRAVAYSKGVSDQELIDGDAQHLAFADGEFDLVCEFGALHHIPNPTAAVAEMLRVAKRAVFISDCNNFGQGTVIARSAKQVLHAIGLWPAVDFLKTRGKMYSFTEGDGISYSYSVFSNYQQIANACQTVHVVNSGRGDINPYRTAGSVAVLGIKR